MYYAYLYIDPAKLNVFYVGKGKDGRAYDHLNRNDKCPLVDKINSLKNSGLSPIIHLIECSTEEIAYELEKNLIKLIGRRDLGTGNLFNCTDGGEGGFSPWTEERRKQKSDFMRGNSFKRNKKESVETRTKKSLARRGSKNPMFGMKRPDVAARNRLGKHNVCQQ